MPSGLIVPVVDKALEIGVEKLRILPIREMTGLVIDHGLHIQIVLAKCVRERRTSLKVGVILVGGPVEHVVTPADPENRQAVDTACPP